MVQTIFDVSQIILATLLVVSILLQAKGDGLGSAFGGSGGVVSTRRGPEKGIFIFTIITAILFIGLSLGRLFV